MSIIIEKNSCSEKKAFGTKNLLELLVAKLLEIGTFILKMFVTMENKRLRIVKR